MAGRQKQKQKHKQLQHGGWQRLLWSSASRRAWVRCPDRRVCQVAAMAVLPAVEW